MPIATPEQRKLRTTYCNLMEEIKIRVTITGKALNGDFNLPDRVNVEFCFLQVRFICELIALACLAAHGDNPKAKNNKFRDAYRADQILKALEVIQPEFFPEPGISLEDANEGVKFVPSDSDDYIKKPELLALYWKCDHHLHMGSFGGLSHKYLSDPDFKSLEDNLPKIARLLNTHRIKLLEPDQELHVALKSGPNNNVRAILVAPR